jgi:hypothetical protein
MSLSLSLLRRFGASLAPSRVALARRSAAATDSF